MKNIIKKIATKLQKFQRFFKVDTPKGTGKVYLVFEEREVDGGFGDAVLTDNFLFATTSKDDADKWVKKWHDPKVYDSPYDDLYEGAYRVDEARLFTSVPVDKAPSEF